MSKYRKPIGILFLAVGVFVAFVIILNNFQEAQSGSQLTINFNLLITFIVCILIGIILYVKSCKEFRLYKKKLVEKRLKGFLAEIILIFPLAVISYIAVKKLQMSWPLIFLFVIAFVIYVLAKEFEYNKHE